MPRPLRVAVIGAGPALERRLAQLLAAGAETPLVFAPLPSPTLLGKRDIMLAARLPAARDLAGISLVFISGLPQAAAAELAAIARAVGALVHVEDEKEITSFHMPAIVRRGELLVAVSTGGASPTLARRLKALIEKLIGPEWGHRVATIGRARERWRQAGLRGDEIAERTTALIEARGWLGSPAHPPPRVRPGHAERDVLRP